MELVDNDKVRIKTPQGEGLYTYLELKMIDRRSENGLTMPGVLFKKFAERSGVIHSENTKYDSILPDTAKRLNRKLKDLFGIEDSIYSDHYKKRKAYITSFRIDDKRES